MSKFIDTLKKMARSDVQPMGFGARQSTAPKPKIRLIASFARDDAGSLAEKAKEADVGLLRVSKLNPALKSLQSVSRVIPDVPWGLWLQDGILAETKELLKAGCDFVVFPAAGTPLTQFRDNEENGELGRILEIDASVSEGLLRAASELPVDAVLITVEKGNEYSLTWQHLLQCRRFTGLLTKPLLVTVPSNVTGGEVKSLWETGISGVVVEVTDGQPQGGLTGLRQAISEMLFPSSRTWEKIQPRLPRIGLESRMIAEEEEEEDE